MKIRNKMPRLLLVAALTCVSITGHAKEAAAKLSTAAQELASTMAESLLPQALAADPELKQAVDEGRVAARAELTRLLQRWSEESRPKLPRGTPEGMPMLARLLEAVSSGVMHLPLQFKVDMLKNAAAIDAATSCSFGPTTSLVLLDPPALTAKLASSSPEARRAYIAQSVALVRAMGQDQPAPAAPWPDYENRVWGAAFYAATYPSSAPVPLPERAVRLVLRRPEADADVEEDRLARCEMGAWWARTALTRSAKEQAEEADALAYYAMATMPLRVAEEIASGHLAEPLNDAPVGYPSVAARFGITGRTLMEVTADDEGRPTDVRIVGRKVEVPGLSGRSTLVFENVFDEAAVSAALARTYPRKAAEPTGKKRLPQKLEVVWKLND
jgi:hypothetical protein